MANVLLHLLPKPPPSSLLFSSSTTRLFHHHLYRVSPKTPLATSKNDSNSPPETECPDPVDQQPINEYQLSTSFPFSWASGDMVEYCSRLFVNGASFAIFIGLPVTWFGAVGADSVSEPLKRVLEAASSVNLVVVRMYLGWAYVGNRLLSVTVEYEETGWYDRQVKPVLSRLEYTLMEAKRILTQLLKLAGRAIAGVYDDNSARSFEPEAFCGEPGIP
ncbi:hypothetical protein HS088_TW23G00905 [Tripterygium wilfordii]|uniref:Uncharacterized protein n=1 Tax=Tripterygium wilfordii TaxID=458696 RepID=A0A7J7BWB7_TRIWF|nr:hypothetical protein HS088_TW23G00905 [Tripterygium wilfordii]